MKISLMLTLVLFAGLANAKQPYQPATIVAMNSVPCGSQGKGYNKTRQMLCQEYVLRSGNMEYHIRQKEEKSAALLQVGQQGEFRIDKDRMRLRAVDSDGNRKERQFRVVEMKPSTQ